MALYRTALIPLVILGGAPWLMGQGMPTLKADHRSLALGTFEIPGK